MTWHMRRIAGGSILVALLVGGGVGPRHAAAQDTATTVVALSARTHFHGIAVDAADPARVLLASHHGFWTVDTSGRAQLVSERRDDFMGFTPHPSDASILYASGHPAGGGNLGVIISRDRGRTWQALADGAGGPVDFHQLDVSRSAPQVMYGVFGALQRSDDGGRHWIRIGPPPPELIDLAVSPADPNVLFAATRSGLFRSGDGGKSWSREFAEGHVATMVHAADAAVFAFVAGIGLVRRGTSDGAWNVVSKASPETYLLHLAVAPADPQRLYAVAHNARTESQSIMVSRDGGTSWTPIGND